MILPRFFVLPFFFLFFLPGCVGSRSTPDPATARKHLQIAESFAQKKHFAAAAQELGRAVSAQPGAPLFYLKQAEYLEASGEFKGARNVYHRGLERVEPSAPAAVEMAWRLGLLEALHLKGPEEAKRVLKKIPEETSCHDDLQGVIALADGNAREAIAHFNTALRRQPEPEVAAAVYFHASQAYRKLGDDKNTFGSLFHAVNSATHRGQIRDIEALWTALNAER